MRTYGEIKFCRLAAFEGAKEKCFWKVTAVPHVMIKIKRTLPKVDKGEFGSVVLSHSPETCRDLEWFAERYPLRFPDQESEYELRNGSKRYQKTLLELEEITLPNTKPRDFNLAMPLRHYQSQGVELHLKARSLLLADQLGLGKTATAIGSLTQKEALPALVVCQTHLCEQWQSEIKKFLPDAKVHIIKKSKQYDLPPAEVYICSYHKLAGWANVWVNGFFKSIIVDEIQELRHRGTDKYNAVEAIRSTCEYAIGLSATPIYNYGGEIWNIYNILSPGTLGSNAEFLREWCVGRNMKWVIEDPEAFGQYLRENFLMLRRTRQDAGLELPKVQRIIETISYDEKILNDVRSVASELARIILESANFHEKGEAARQFDLKLRQATGIAKAAHVADFVRRIVEDGQKVLLFGWHREVYNIWAEKLKDLNPVFYTGEENASQKGVSKHRFVNGDAQVMIMSLRSGVGVDGLQKVCCTNVFGELDWSPGVHDQCEGRTNRDGVIGPVSSFFLCADEGSDPPMAEVLGLKTAQVQGILQVKETGEEKSAFEQSELSLNRVKHMAEQYLGRK